jgi:hypothetical protein
VTLGIVEKDLFSTGEPLTLKDEFADRSTLDAPRKNAAEPR